MVYRESVHVVTKTDPSRHHRCHYCEGGILELWIIIRKHKSLLLPKDWRGQLSCKSADGAQSEDLVSIHLGDFIDIIMRKRTLINLGSGKMSPATSRSNWRHWWQKKDDLCRGSQLQNQDFVTNIQEDPPCLVQSLPIWPVPGTLFTPGEQAIWVCLGPVCFGNPRAWSPGSEKPPSPTGPQPFRRPPRHAGTLNKNPGTERPMGHAEPAQDGRPMGHTGAAQEGRPIGHAVVPWVERPPILAMPGVTRMGGLRATQEFSWSGSLLAMPEYLKGLAKEAIGSIQFQRSRDNMASLLCMILISDDKLELDDSGHRSVGLLQCHHGLSSPWTPVVEFRLELLLVPTFWLRHPVKMCSLLREFHLCRTPWCLLGPHLWPICKHGRPNDLLWCSLSLPQWGFYEWHLSKARFIRSGIEILRSPLPAPRSISFCLSRGQGCLNR